MCFSAEASFIAGSILMLIGSATLRKVRQLKHYALIPLALTPLLFGIQQFFEGALWLGLMSNNTSSLYTLGLHGFLLFALFWWPWWLPFALAYAEPHTMGKRVLYTFSCIGILLGTYLIIPTYSATLVNNHISYAFGNASLEAFMIYSIVVIAPFFISSLRFMWMLGLMSIISLAITFLAYFYWITSLWCFFTALLSSSIFIIIRNNHLNLR